MDTDHNDVNGASNESFPASDPPGWIHGSASPEDPPPRVLEVPKRFLREGLIAGLLGYASLVLLIATVDAARGRSPFFTAAQMGSSLFFGSSDLSPLGGWAGPILAYNGVHLAASLVVGLLGAALIKESERFRGFWYLALIVLLAFGVYAVTLLGVFGREVWRVTDWTTVILGTAVWLSVMTTYFWWGHRRSYRRIRNELQAGM